LDSQNEPSTANYSAGAWWQEHGFGRFTIANVHPRLVQLGSLAIPTSGAFAAVAILAALFSARFTARRLDLDPEKVWDLGIVGVLAALFAPRLVLIFANWKDFVAHPLWMIGVVGVRSPAAVAGGAAIAIAAAAVFLVFARLPFRRTLDALAPAFALGAAIASLGDFAGGSRFGTPSRLPWAVAYANRLASLWNGTPLGAPLHPTPIYAALAQIGLFALLAAMIAKRDDWQLRDGETMGAWLFLGGAASFCLNFLRGDLVSGGAASFGFAQALAVGMVLGGGVLWL